MHQSPREEVDNAPSWLCLMDPHATPISPQISEFQTHVLITGRISRLIVPKNSLLNENERGEIGRIWSTGLEDRHVAIRKIRSICGSQDESDWSPGFRTVFRHAVLGGCFDLCHKGHEQLIKRSQEICAKLTVAINTDRSVTRMKGKGRPVDNIYVRTRNVNRLLRENDETIIVTATNGAQRLSEISPSLYIKGSDYWDSSIPEAQRATPPIPTLLIDNGSSITTTRILQSGVD